MKKFKFYTSSASVLHSDRLHSLRPGGSTVIPVKLTSMLLMLFLAALSANASIWYVDNKATGANNGTSWANAWTSVTSANSVVKSGDTVYISGGPSGSSQTYSSGTWSPTGGSSSGVVTYQIGQDSAHNGTAVFSGSGSVFGGSLNYVTISGDAGDGNMHFATSGFSTIAWNQSSMSGLRIGYVNFGQMSGSGGGNSDVMYLAPVTGFEFDHNYVYFTDPAGNAFAFIRFSGSTWDQSKVHDNTIYVPHAAGDPGQGADGIETGGSTGYSLYNNTIVSYPMGYTGGQHADGWQDTGGSSYTKIYGNKIINFGNFAVFGDATFGDFTHIWIYNNIVMISETAAQAGSPGGIIFGVDGGYTGSTATFSDVVIANNIAVDYGNNQVGFALNNHTSKGAQFPNCVVANNIQINTPGPDLQGNNTTPVQDQISYTSAQAASKFVKYVLDGGLNNDFHLLSGDTDLIGKGVNESSYFTTDQGGGARPASGAWDIGPYQYGSTGGSGGGTTNAVPPTVSAVTQNASDVDPVTAGVQVYEGTTVQYSGSGSVPNGDGMNWTWSYTVNGGTSTNFQTGSGATVPSIGYTYTTGTGGKTYVWTLTIKDTTTLLTAQSSLTMSVETPPAAGTNLTFLAGQYASLTAPMVLSGGYISQATQTTVVASGGHAVYNFTLTNAGNYVIQALVNAPSDSANSMFVNIDGEPVTPTMIWDIPMTSGFQQRIVSWRGTGTDTNNQFVPEVFSLGAGTHQAVFVGREAGVQLQSFSILQLLAAPQNLHVLPSVVTSPTFSAGQ
jgi:hypothetical protein